MDAVLSLQLLVFIADFVFPSRRFSAPDYHQSEFLIFTICLKVNNLSEQTQVVGAEFDYVSLCGAEKQYSQQARLLQQEDELEADGEEDDDEDEEQDDSWRTRRGSPEGRPESKGQKFSDEALRRRVVGNRQEDEDDEEEDA